MNLSPISGASILIVLMLNSDLHPSFIATMILTCTEAVIPQPNMVQPKGNGYVYSPPNIKCVVYAQTLLIIPGTRQFFKLSGTDSGCKNNGVKPQPQLRLIKKKEKWECMLFSKPSTQGVIWCDIVS